MCYVFELCESTAFVFPAAAAVLLDYVLRLITSQILGCRWCFFYVVVVVVVVLFVAGSSPLHIINPIKYYAFMILLLIQACTPKRLWNEHTHQNHICLSGVRCDFYATAAAECVCARESFVRVCFCLGIFGQNVVC